jgi:dTDP-glucose 4,6-dehydratase
MRTLVTRTTNIYGPFQSLDKLIPTIVSSVVEGKPVPVFGTGENLRDWIHVDDHNRGVLKVLESGGDGQVYHLGARCERSNIELIRQVVTATAELTGGSPEEALSLLTFVRDRDAHDARRALDPSRSERELGFKPRVSFREGLRDTVKWVLMNSGRNGG